MIITLTLNPALDKTLVLDSLAVGRVNRVSTMRSDPGGKGLVVAKTLNALGEDVLAIGIIGGETGANIARMLEQSGIRYDFVNSEVDTRVNIKLVDLSENSYTEINEPGNPIPLSCVEEATEKMLSKVKEGDIVVLSGSIPEGCPHDCYARLVPFIHDKGAKVYIDCDGKSLEAAANTDADFLKPNKFELAKLCNCDPEDDIACLQHARRLVKNGIKSILLSLGSYGAIYVDKERTIRALGLKVPIVGRSGAGDALVAGMARGELLGLSIEDRLRLAVASAAAKIMVAGSQAPERETAEMLIPKVVLSPLEK